MGGWNADAQAWEIPVSQAPQLDNFLIRPGKLVNRGPLQVFTDFSTYYPLNPCGIQPAASGLAYSIAARVTGATCDNWNAPLCRAGSGQLASVSTTQYIASAMGTTGTTGVSWASVDYPPGPRLINFNGSGYYISFDSTGGVATDANATYHVKPTNLVQTNFSSSSVLCTGAPHGAFDVIGFQGALWMLGGIDTPASGTTHSPVTLFFSNPANASYVGWPAWNNGISATDWQDPVHGTTNKIVMDGDANDFGVGLGVVKGGMVVFRSDSVWLLKGSSSANYSLLPITQNCGCIDARSIVETDHGIYFMSRLGLMLTNGATVTNVSGGLTYLLRDVARYIVAQNSTPTTAQAWCTAKITSAGQILVSAGTTSGSTGKHAPVLTAMYDPYAAKGGAWVRVTSQLFANDGVQVGTNNYAGMLFGYQGPTQLVSIGDRYLTSFENPAYNQSFLDSHAGLYDVNGTSFLSIPCAWTTPIPAIMTSLKRVYGHAHRYFVDYQFAASAGLVPTTGWTIAPYDSSGNMIDTNGVVTLPVGSASVTGWASGITPVATPFIKRFNRDWFEELQADPSFQVTWSDINRTSQATGVLAEIYGLGTEIQRSRDQRNVP